MENCLVLKLKGASTNTNLPIYQNVVSKDLMTVLTDIPSVTFAVEFNIDSSIKYNNFKSTLKFKVPTNSPCLTSENECKIFTTRGGHASVLITNGTLNIKITGTGTVYTTSVVANTEYTIILNSYNNTVSVNGTTTSFEKSWATTGLQICLVFGEYVESNSVFVSSIELCAGNADTVVHDFTPAIVNDVSCFKDSINNTYTYSSYGELLAFNS